MDPSARHPDDVAGAAPRLDPDVEAHVVALLAAAADVGPMPERFARRIEAALADEVRLRVEPGPLLAADRDRDVISPLGSHRRQPTSWLAVAAVAAAAAVVAVGGSALHATKRSNGAAAIRDTVSNVSTVSAAPSSPTSTGASAPATGVGNPHIQLSTTAYDAGNLAMGARRLLQGPVTPLDPLAAEAPTIGPIGTPVGLASCLDALGVTDADAVSADIATFQGRPATVVVVTRAGRSTAWAVERSCSRGAPGILADATPVP